MTALLVLWLIGTVLGLAKAKAPTDVALVLSPSLLVAFAFGVQPYVVEINGLVIKVLCLLFAAGLPVVARAHIEGKQRRAEEAAKADRR